MKNLLYITGLALTMLFLGACNSLDDIEPTFRLPADEAIVNAATAENAIAGVYSKFREYTLVRGVQSTHSLMGLSDGSIFSPEDPLLVNTPEINTSQVEGLYGGCYSIIQDANLFIERVEGLTPEDLGGEAAQNSFIAEGKFARALAHFYLLRAYGQFYDVSSQYGITLRLKAVYNAEPKARSSVKESYDAIYEDLDYAIANIGFNPSHRANLDAAKSLKAKVLLYEGEYQQAADLAQDVINSTSRSFAFAYSDNFGAYDQFTGVFTYAHESPELIFGPFGNEDDERLQGLSTRTDGSVYASIARPDPFDVSTWDPRAVGAESPWFPGEYDPLDKIPGYIFFPDGGFASTPVTQTHLRLAGVYMIHAEAAARVGTGVDANALASLNAVRTRDAVGLPELVDGVDITTKAELLEAIRMESLLELFAETGEEFFALVRYEKAGDLTAADIKPTMTNPDFYILPIPWTELQIIGALDVIEQNPGYPTTL